MDNEIYSKFSKTILQSNAPNLDAAYNDLLSKLVNPTRYHIQTGYDDGSFGFTLEKGWDSYFEYTPEGMVGLTISSLTPKKTSTISFGRMYFANGVEPDYMVVARYYSKDQFLNSITVDYDENNIIGIISLAPLFGSGVNRYRFLFTFIKNDGLINIDKFYIEFLGNNQLIYDDRFVYGYKEYQRADLNYNLYDVMNENDNPITVNQIPINGKFPPNKKHVILDTLYNKNAFSIGKSNIVSKVFSTGTSFNILHTYKPSIKNISNVQNKQVRFGERHDLIKTFDYKFFIEGAIDKKSISIKSTKTNFSYYNEGESDNGYVYLNSLVWDEYTIKAENYTRKFNSNSLPMVKGSLSGSVNVLGCEGENNNFKIKCYRSYDDYLIGEYSLEFGKYNIHNLDVNTKYNIILVDLNQNLESKILSNRVPIPYENTVYIYRPTSLNWNLITSNNVFISWRFAGDVDTFTIYRSNNPINVNSLPISLMTTKQYSYNDVAVEGNNVYYYMIAAKVADDDIRYSDNLKVLT